MITVAALEPPALTEKVCVFFPVMAANQALGQPPMVWVQLYQETQDFTLAGI